MVFKMQALTIQNVVLEDRDFRRISDLVYQYCGINLHDGKKELVRARLAKRLRLGNFKTFAEYISHILEDKTGQHFATLIDSISTNLTSFFREPQHFEFLSKNFLPALLERKEKKRKFKIRTWSAGCSSGEEAYSIAITLLEAIKGQSHWDTKILATDIATTMLEKAKKGLYSEERIMPVPTLQRHKYLIQHCIKGQKVFEVSKSMRNVTIFKYMNLINNWPIKAPLDFIFCRNVMIYFDKPTQRRLITRFWDLLDSGGILFTGHSESLTGIDHKFNYIQPTIYVKP